MSGYVSDVYKRPSRNRLQTCKLENDFTFYTQPARMESTLTDSQLYQAAEEIESLQAAIGSITDSQLIRATEDAEAQERALEELARLLREPSSTETSTASDKFYELAKLLGGETSTSTRTSTDDFSTIEEHFLKGWLTDARAEGQSGSKQDAAWDTPNPSVSFNRLLTEPILLQRPFKQQRRPNNGTVISISSTEYSVLDDTPGPIVNRLVG
jgi:hypothetical protein